MVVVSQGGQHSLVDLGHRALLRVGAGHPVRAAVQIPVPVSLTLFVR
jgi:hypothetical protein